METLKPFPRRWVRLDMENTSKHRVDSIYCKLYNLCLDEAIRLRWSGWTCRDCPGFPSRRKEELPSELPTITADSERIKEVVVKEIKARKEEEDAKR